MIDEAYPKTETSEQEHKRDYSGTLRRLLEHDQFKDGDVSGLYKRETHVRKGTANLSSGEHLTLYFNAHTAGSPTLPEVRHISAECFVQITPAGPAHARTSDEKFYRWSITQDPEDLYPDEADLIWEAIGMFEPVGAETSGQA